jgi:hypothetical protein
VTHISAHRTIETVVPRYPKCILSSVLNYLISTDNTNIYIIQLLFIYCNDIYLNNTGLVLREIIDLYEVTVVANFKIIHRHFCGQDTEGRENPVSGKRVSG